MPRRSKRTPRVAPSPNVSGLIRGLKRQLRLEADGRRYTPSRTPRPIVAVPWNSIVLTDFQTSQTTIASPNVFNTYFIYVSLLDQLGLTGSTPSLEFRVERVEMWNEGIVGGNLDPGLIMDVYPLQSLATPPVLARIEDEAGKNQWACCGWEWPRSHRNYVFSVLGAAPSSDPTLFRFYSSIPGSRVWVRVHILWRTVSDTPPQYRRHGVGFEVLGD